MEIYDEYKYLGVLFNKRRADVDEINSRIVGPIKTIACLNGILWSKESLISMKPL